MPETSNRNRVLWWLYGASFVFLAINAICIAYEFYWLNLLPPMLFVILLALVALDKLLLLAVFVTPLSINLADNEVKIGLSLPAEPLLIGVLFVYMLRMLHDVRFDKRFVRHPVTIAIILNLLWMFITSVTSELPLVSFKFLLSRLWFVIPLYFVGVHIFRDIANVRRFLWLYIIPLTIVIGYTLYQHWLYGFEEDPAHWVMSPFYNDHTAYGAALAMFFPALVAFSWSKRYSSNIRIISLILLGIFAVALVFSYTRAAWLSLAAVFVLYFIFLFRIRFMYLFVPTALAAIVVMLSWTEIQMKLEKNRQDTSDDLAEHIQSISNISTDASNLERINRWNSAYRMFEERPVFGWGPGTYSFVYAPFQLSGEKTIISTNAGDMGNAHSEYIGPLCESGVLGTLTFLGIVVTIIWTGWRLYYKLTDKIHRGLMLSILLGMVTYFLHGALNNFLDTDKASVPFWGFAAMLVAADLWYEPEKKEKLEEEVVQPNY
ncbi:MAG: O-antigen ligase family protein [Bacteroidetes bacterium]|jgi:putative inorganic carbon (HCO3(-)) transporter|nr:O-antigen ligase family protein [Bacteroidota bacterium]